MWMCQGIPVDLLLKDDIHRSGGRWVPQKGAGLYRYIKNRKWLTKQATFCFVIHVKIFCWCHCFCRPEVQRTLWQGRENHSECSLSGGQHGLSLWKQLGADCIPFSRFQRAGETQVTHLWWRVWSVQWVWACPGLQCCPGPTPQLRFLLQNQLQTQPHTWPSDQPKLLPDGQYFHSRDKIIITTILFLQPHKS